MTETGKLGKPLHLAVLQSNDKDFVAVMLNIIDDEPKLLILVADEDGVPVNDQMISGTDILAVREFFTQVVGMIDLASKLTGAALN